MNTDKFTQSKEVLDNFCKENNLKYYWSSSLGKDVLEIQLPEYLIRREWGRDKESWREFREFLLDIKTELGLAL